MVSLFRKTMFLMILLSWSTLVVSTLAASGDQAIYINAINPPEVYPGGTVHVYGGGATPGSVVVAKLVGLPRDAVVNNLTLGSAVAGETGDWQIDFVAPIIFSGNCTIHVFDDRNVPSNLASFQVLMNITIVPVTNFTYGEVTNMTWPYIPVTNMTWPYIPMTNITLPILVNTTMPILFFVPFTATPASGPPGIFVTVSGRYASGGEIQVYLNNTHVASVSKPSSGDWSTSFQIPSVSPGNYTIRAIDTGARIISFASFSVTSEVSLSPTPLLLLIGLFALATISGLVMLALLAVYTRQHKKSISDRR
jgi:hypothetical protein